MNRARGEWFGFKAFGRGIFESVCSGFGRRKSSNMNFVFVVGYSLDDGDAARWIQLVPNTLLCWLNLKHLQFVCPPADVILSSFLVLIRPQIKILNASNLPDVLWKTQSRTPGLQRCTLLPGGWCKRCDLSSPSDLPLSPSHPPGDFPASDGNDNEEDGIYRLKGKEKRRNAEINPGIGCRAR